MSAAPSPPLAIIGVGCLFPGSADFASLWSRIVNKVDAIRDVPATHWRREDYHDPDPKAPDRVYSARGGFLDPVEVSPQALGVAPTNLEATDSSQLLGLVVAEQALADCGYRISSAERPAPAGSRAVDRSRVSVILGVTGTLELVIPLGARLGHPIWRRALKEAGVAADVAEDVVARIGEAYVPWQENSFPGLLGNVVAGRIANRLDLGGTNCVVDAACASSLGAVHLAAMELATGRADVVLTGGIDTFNDVFMFTCFSKTPALSPTGHARPFDAEGDGTTLGEGLGVVVLKRLEDARRDGDRVYAVLRGVGSASDGKGNAIYAPKKEGQVEALRAAYRVSGVGPETVELVEAHGTGTKVGDATEVGALAEVYRATGRAGRWCAVGSIKSQIGHTKAAAGVAGLLKAVAALHHKVLPPTIKVRRPLDVLLAEDCPLYVNTEKRPWMPATGHPRRAAVSAFGFGGSNFHAVLEEAGPEKAEIDWTGEVQLVALGAASAAELARALDGWPRELSWEELGRRADRSRRDYRADAPFRVVLVVERERTDVARLLAAAREAVERGEGRPAEGVYYGAGPAAGGLAVLFPGQGAQYCGMLRDLTCHFPPAHAAFAAADRAFGGASGERLVDRVYPRPAFTAEGRAAQEKGLQGTATAQPALGAVSLGAWRVLESFGVRADAFAGHSYGELVALAAAGRLGDEELYRLSQLRGRLMAEAGAGGDAGAMLAVKEGEEEIRRVLAEEGLDLVLANRNAPAQTVLSGPTAAVERAAAAFARKKIGVVRLAVGAAFHSPLVAAASGPLLEALAGVEMPAGAAVYANTTATPYPADAGAARGLLAGQLARPVLWAQQLEAMYAAGARSFLEVGPGARLTGLVGATLGARAQAVALDASSGQRGGQHDLACALAWLAARGHAVELARWCPAEGEPPPRKAGLTVQLSGANYVKPRAPRPPRAAAAVVPVAGAEPARPSVPAPSVALPRPEDRPRQPAPVPVPSRPDPRSSTMSYPTPADRSGAIDGGALARALDATRESLSALQKMQEQTAHLHRQFLDGQDQAHRTVHLLVEQQQRLLQASLGLPVAAAAPMALPAPAPLALPPVASEPARPAWREQPVAPAPAAPPVAAAPPAPPAPPVAARVEAPALSAVPTPTPAALASAARVEGVLLEVIAEKTGYPADMLELGMALDADLGIDSIKRVEILSALQERLPDAPAVKPEHLGTLHTLRDIASFLAGADAAPTPPAGTNGHHGPALAASAGRVEGVLLEVIAEKTGYPADMLELGMALDADLGIDSIKRVEILSALQERLPDAPAVKPEHLGTLHTLRDIASFLAGGGRAGEASAEPARGAPGEPSRPPEAPPTGSAGASPARPAPSQGAPTQAAPASGPALERSVVRAVPLEGPRELVDLPAGAEVWVGDDDPGVAAVVEHLLAARGLRVRRLPCQAMPGQPAPAALGGLILVAPGQGLADDFLLAALMAVKHLSGPLKAGGALLTVARVDGAFGLGGGPLGREPIDGGLAGLAKTVGQEWPQARARALDVAPGVAADLAGAFVAEELFLTGLAEVGRTAGGRTMLRREVEAVADGAHVPVQPGELVVVSGGARGVTAEVAVALAGAFRPRLALLGRSPLPGEEPAWLAGLADEAAVRQELARRQPGASPRSVGEQARALLAEREVRTTLARARAAGAEVVYRSVDVRDARAAAAAVEELRRQFGPVRALIHGAGVLADARIEDKTAEQFAAVYGTKVGGLRGLLAGAGEGLRALVLFSSSTARFGRAGQVDYAMANEVLNKVACAEAARRPGCRVVSLNWGPWDGGMVTPGLKALFAREGVGTIPLAAGAELVVRELRGGEAGPAEVVVLGAGSAVERPAPAAPAAGGPHLPPALPGAFERVLDPVDYPVLAAHVLDGRAVVPVALLLEWLAHAALMQGPGLKFHGCDDLRVLHGLTLEGAPVTVRVGAAKAARREGLFVAAAEVRSLRPDGREVLHARADVILANALPAAPAASPPPAGLAPYRHAPAEAYRRALLFHGPALQAVRAVGGCGEAGIVGEVKGAPPAAEWVRQPLRQAWLGDPLALDGAFQLMILWSQEVKGAGNLPCHLRRYRQYRRSFPTGGVRVVAWVERASDLQALATIEFLDGEGAVVARVEGYECALDAGLARAFKRRELAPA